MIIGFVLAAGCFVFTSAIHRVLRGDLHVRDWSGELVEPSWLDAASRWWLLAITVGTFYWISHRWGVSRRTQGFTSAVPGLSPGVRGLAVVLAVLLMMMAHLVIPGILQQLVVFEKHPNLQVVTGWGNLAYALMVALIAAIAEELLIVVPILMAERRRVPLAVPFVCVLVAFSAGHLYQGLAATLTHLAWVFAHFVVFARWGCLPLLVGVHALQDLVIVTARSEALMHYPDIHLMVVGCAFAAPIAFMAWTHHGPRAAGPITH